MKKLYIGLFCILSLLACKKEESAKNKEVIVSLGFKGEIVTIQEEPFSKANESPLQNLYGVQVYSCIEGGSVESYQPYAYGVFEDVSNLTITLKKGEQYLFFATMITDGVNTLYKSSNRYSYPFVDSKNKEVPVVSSSFVYSNSYVMEGIANGKTRMKQSSIIYEHPNTERYFGVLEGYIPSSNNALNIEMKRVSYRIKIIANGLRENDVIKMSMTNSPDLFLNYNPSTEEQSIVGTYTFDDLQAIYYGYKNNSSYEREKLVVSIDLQKATDSDGSTEPLLSDTEIYVKRNIQTTFTINLSDSQDNPINFSTLDEDYKNEDYYKVINQ